MIKRIALFFKQNIIVTISWCLAIVTSFIVPPDREYLGYFDFKTLCCLFCALAVVCALKGVHFFQILARKIVCIFKNTRSAVLALVYITFIGSMFLANDMALITFLPLGYFVLTQTNHKELMAYTFIMQNIAANLGGMLTPFGNPQNLYLYSYFNIETLEFFKIMFIPFAISITLITICCLLVKKSALSLDEKEGELEFDVKNTVIYLLLFVLAISIVFGKIPYLLGVLVIGIVLLIKDRNALKEVDYGLLLTFCAFFVLSGNLARIEIIKEFLSLWINKNTLLYSTLSCQVISNVPSAILLSHFTTNYPELLIGVNIGGTGTLISSLASLITLGQYSKYEPSKIKNYILQFSLYNFLMLSILCASMLFINKF